LDEKVRFYGHKNIGYILLSNELLSTFYVKLKHGSINYASRPIPAVFWTSLGGQPFYGGLNPRQIQPSLAFEQKSKKMKNVDSVYSRTGYKQ